MIDTYVCACIYVYIYTYHIAMYALFILPLLLLLFLVPFFLLDNHHSDIMAHVSHCPSV